MARPKKTPAKEEMELDAIEERAAGSGYAPTKLRRLVLRLLIEAGGPVKAYDMVDAAKAQGLKLTPATCYRVLDYLQAAGLVHKVNSINAYVACRRSGAESGHHPLILVCPDCRKATEIDDAGILDALVSRLGALGHFVEAKGVEIHGLCRECSGK